MKSAQEISNSQKAQTGHEVKTKVEELLNHLHNQKLISNYSANVSYSHRRYSYDKQFKSDFIIETIDNKFIFIRASNSYRSDRAKISFYDFLGIQNYSEFAGDIVASILLFPDGEELNSSFVSTRDKVHSGEFYSPATHWLTFSELTDFVENYCSEVESLMNFSIPSQLEPTEDDLSLYSRDFSSQLDHVEEKCGSYYGRSGNKFEKYLVEELNDLENFKNYIIGKSVCFEFDLVLEALLSTFNLLRDDLVSIVATDTITKLKNLGSPKTDIHIKIFTSKVEYFIANISLKNTGSNRVSCHDYKARDFSRVIAPDDHEFELAVNTFQEAGSWSKLAELQEKQKIDVDVPRALQKHMVKIIEWAITGEHDHDNILSRETQVANFLLTRNSKSGACKMETSEEYIKEILKQIGTTHGAPFSWTFPSKRRGERIQLKMPITLPQK